MIACETLRDEYADAADRSGRHYDTYWVESGLHNFPEKLGQALSQEFDKVDADRVLLCFGTCGNAVVGLETRDFELIMPRVDDCISLLLGGTARRLKINEAHTSYFLTAGWLRGERNIYVEYEYAVQKYGEKRGKRIMETVLANYTDLVLLDTGSYDIAPARTESAMIAEKLGLELKTMPAGVGYICELLTGPYPPERFCVFPPKTKIGTIEPV